LVVFVIITDWPIVVVIIILIEKIIKISLKKKIGMVDMYTRIKPGRRS